MNAPEKLPLPDVQAAADHRALAIDQVGVRGVRHPLTIRLRDGAEQPTVATLEMTVALAAEVKGTHMSRFLEVLQAQDGPLDAQGLRALALRMLARLEAAGGQVLMRFPFFLRKRAPVSGVESLLDYEAMWRVSVEPGRIPELWVRVVVPVTSLCPCSKEISAYGAHNQRSHITIDAELAQPVHLEDLVEMAEQEASCALWGLLKRPDEKYVTERAYDNPKFVEDLVRDVALRLSRDLRVRRFVVESENFESIHNHSAYARLSGRGLAF